MNLRNRVVSNNDVYIRETYNKIIGLAIFAHASYILIFGFISYFWLTAYNVLSTLFYVCMLIAVAKGYFKFAVAAIHVEACLFVMVCTLLCGWSIGVALYLPAMASLVYFCPFDRKYIPYIFSAVEMAMFLALRLYTWKYDSNYMQVSENVRHMLYIYSACEAFAIIMYAGFISNVSATVTEERLQEENETLSRLADYDGLTNLLSRRCFVRKMAEHLDEDLAISMGDIDDFKLINDTYGHVCGDYVLTSVAAVLRKCCPDEVEVCRWGGEEFMFMFSSLEAGEVRRLVNEMCEAIRKQEFIWRGNAIHVTMTFGIAFGGGNDSPLDLIDIADRYMYIGKKQGKNRVITL